MIRHPQNCCVNLLASMHGGQSGALSSGTPFRMMRGPRHLIDQWTKDTLWHSFVLVPDLMATGVTWLDLTVIRGQGS